VNAIVVPVRAAGELIGALGLASHGSSLSADDLNLLEAVAHQLAVALDNSRHYQEAKKALEELADAQESLRTYLRLATDAQEEERKRLARELHDDTIQSLVVIKATLDTLTAGQRTSGAVKDRLDAVKQMVEATVDGVRRFSRDLRPSVLDDLGLVQAVDSLITDMARRTNIQTFLDVEGESRRFSGDAELAVFRIAQEALRNVEWHSGAANARVALTFSPEGLVAQVADDGSGFDLGQVMGEHGNDVPLGLVGMQERAKLVGGALEIETQPHQGTKVTVTLMSRN
jgi:signal transduction histidine kinase